MSGHSKWAQIKRQKGVADIRRGQTFTKLANAITVAVRQGGGVTDPSQNFRLRLVIEKAREVNMPKENIDRAIQRAAGKLGGEMEEVIYEGFAPGGVAVVIEAATDNRQRTISSIKNIFDKAGGSLGQPGSVSYQFKQMGKIVVEKKDKTLEEVFLMAAEAQAEDVEEAEGEFWIYTDVGSLSKVRSALIEKGFSVLATELIRKPLTQVNLVDPAKLQKVQKFLLEVEELDDVQKVYSNLG